MAKSILKDALGLSELEVKTYFILLNLGPQPASIIATKINCPRSSVYPVLERMLKRGVITYCLRRKIKYFSAIDLKRLENKLSEKEEMFIAQIDLIKRSRRKLKDYFRFMKTYNKQNNLLNEAKVQTYIGLEGIKNMWNILSATNAEILGYGWLSKNLNELETDSWGEFTKNSLKKKKNKLRILIPSTDYSRCISDLAKKDLREILAVDPTLFPFFPVQINIVSDYYAYFARNNDLIYGILIHDPQLAHNERIVFENMWNQLKHSGKKIHSI